MKTKQKLSQEHVNKIAFRALSDKKFKQAILNNPKETIEKEFGVVTDQQLKVLENDETKSYIALPHLTQEEIQNLEKQAAGLEKSQDPNARLNFLFFKCLKDQNLRKRLIANPKQCIEQECGFQLPENVTVKVVEDNENLTHIILPQANAELSEHDMKQLSGGIVFVAALAGLIYLGIKAQADLITKHPEFRDMRPL